MTIVRQLPTLFTDEITTRISWLKPTDFTEKLQNLQRVSVDANRRDALITNLEFIDALAESMFAVGRTAMDQVMRCFWLLPTVATDRRNLVVMVRLSQW